MPTCPTRHDDVVPDATTTRLTWPEVADRLSPARIYWLHTTGPTGAPQVTAVWAVVAGDRVYLYSARSTVKARNLERDPRVAIHLESGSDVVIVYGVLTDLGTPGDWPAVVDAFATKYDEPDDQPYLPGADPAFDVVYVLEPHRALLWTLPDSEASLRRWVHASGT